MQLASLPRDKRPAACIGCRKCESVCPQQINIPDVLKKLCEITAKKA
jgi:predicted aldo/keto reductase-like oxidoreductase